MDSNKKYPSVDPVDLIEEHYEAVEMPDAFRRELQIKSQNIIAKRRRRRVHIWTFSLAGAFVLAAVLILASRLMYMGPNGGRTAPIHKQLRIATGKKATEKKINPQRKTRNGYHAISISKNADKVTAHSGNIRIKSKSRIAHENKDNIIQHCMKISDSIAVIASTSGRVTNGECKVLVPGERISIGMPVSTGRDGRAILVTRGGSELIMDSGTYFVFTSKDTIRIARGRLYCNNRHKEIAQLNTLAGSIKLLGTTVDANLLRRGKLAVTVVDGKVELSNKHGTSLIDAGNQSVMATYSVPWRGLSAGTIDETAWYQGKGDYQSDFGDIAYTVNRAGGLITEVWTVKEDGSNKHRICSFIGRINDLGPWLPGQRWLTMDYYSPLWTTPDIENHTANSGSGHPIIDSPSWLLDIATGQIQTLDRLPEGYRGFYFSTAPDPRLVAFTGWHKDSEEKNEPGLFLFDRSSGNVTNLLDGDIKTAAAWAPDCKHIAISSGQGYTNDHDLQIIDVETGEAHDLGINGAGACFSPDGKKIAYCGDFKKNGSWYAGVPMSSSIFVMDLSSGSAPVRVSPKEEWATRPRWSPDSSRILYITQNCHVCVVNSDGSGPKDVYCSDGDILRASWSQAGDTLFVTERANDKLSTLAVAADGSGVKKVYSGAVEDNQLVPEVQKQTDEVAAAIKEAIFQYAMGKVHSFEGDLAARRESYTKSRDIFANLVWDYPLSGLCVDDAMKYADVANRELQRADEDILEEACKERIRYLGNALGIAAAKHGEFPPDLATGLEWASDYTWQYNWLRSNDKQHVMMLGACPGSKNHAPTPYIYKKPADGILPEVGQVLVKCPIHPDCSYKWDDYDNSDFKKYLLRNAKPGAWCIVEHGLPYYFENVGSGSLTIIHHLIGDTHEVIGEAKLLPIGKIYNNESLKISEDEADIGREITSAGADWGNIPEEQVSTAQTDLRFCNAVAAFEAGRKVDDPDNDGNLFKIIDGEPARLLFCGPSGGSCGALGSELRFELVGPDSIELYQLKPSGRFRVYGTVRVMQTGQTCKNGWIDKNGNVISTEK